MFTTGRVADHVPVKGAIPLGATPDAGTPERVGRERIVSVRPFQTGIIMGLEDIAAGLGSADQAMGVANDPVGVGRGADRWDGNDFILLVQQAGIALGGVRLGRFVVIHGKQLSLARGRS